MGFLWDLPSGKGLHNWLVVRFVPILKNDGVSESQWVSDDIPQRV